MNFIRRVWHWLFPPKPKQWMFPVDTEARDLIASFERLQDAVADDEEKERLATERAATAAWDQRFRGAGGDMEDYYR